MGRFLNIVVLAGIALIFVSWFWPRIGQKWTDEQAAAYSQSAIRLQQLTYQYSQAQASAKQRGPSAQKDHADQQLGRAAETGTPVDPAAASADRLATELAIAKTRYQHERAQLDHALSHDSVLAIVMRWLGAALVIVGVVVSAVRRSMAVSNKSR